MKNINRPLIVILAFYISICFGQKSYIRSSLPIRQDMVINPDNGRPFSDLAVDYFDNGRIKIKGRYSGGYASGYWSYYYPNGQLKARGRYYKAIDKNLDGLINEGRVGKWIYWFENGSKKMVGTYKNNKKNGNWTYWHQNGFKHSEGRYNPVSYTHLPLPTKA